MPTRVDALPVRAPRTGLALVTAAAATGPADERWVDSFAWQPELPDGASLSGIICAGTVERTPGSQPAIIEYDPFIVWAAENCSTHGWRTRDYEGRVRRALEAQQSAVIAAEFWSAAATGPANPHLCASTATTITTSAQTAPVGLTILDAALTRALANRQGMIHVRPELVDILAQHSMLRWDAGFVLSPLGHVIVADAGYTGDGPRETAEGDVTAAGSTQWMYGTDLVAILLGSVDVLGAGAPPAEGVTRSTNDVTVWAQRPVGIQWDQHAHLAAEVDEEALTP